MKGREEEEKSTNVVTGMLHVFSFPVCVLLHPRSNLSYVTPLVDSKFDVLHEFLNEPFLVSTHIGDNIRAERVYTDCPIIILDRVTYTDL